MADRQRGLRWWRHIVATAAAFAGAPLASTYAQSPEPAPAVAIAWQAPKECPDTAYIEREIARLLAGSSPPSSLRLRARADVTREIEGWRLDLTTTSVHGTGRRTITAETCRALADATALILALAVDPERATTNRALESSSEAASSAPTDVSTPTSTSTSTSPSPSPPTPTPIPPQSPPRPSAFAIGALALADIGTLPSFAPGLGAIFAVAPRFAHRLRIERARASGRRSPPSPLSLAAEGSRFTRSMPPSASSHRLRTGRLDPARTPSWHGFMGMASVDRFLLAFPSSPHIARVRASCGGVFAPPF
jgi:hypothetical protein